jgi:hypothetical protein
MPYYISKSQEGCKNRWAVISADKTIRGCHSTKEKAIAQMVAISIAEDVEPGGVWPSDKATEAAIMREAETFSPPEGVRSAAKRALKWIAEGKAGSGFTDVGRRRASQLASGSAVSREVIGRMRSYFARHEVDKKATGFSSGEDGFPTPGRVAWDAWGGDAGKSWANGINLEEEK